jgi:outer membrane lipoprotein-sorting protein
MTKAFYRSMFVASLLAAGTAYASTLESVEEKLQALKTIQADFEQKRVLKGADTPLVSTGTLTLIRSRGLIWDQTAPFAQTAVLSGKRFKLTVEGDTVQDASAADNPAMQAMMTTLTALFEGNFREIRPLFDLAFEDLTNNHWRIVLKPKEEKLKQLFTEITLEGRDAITNVAMTDKNGDVTTLVFTHQVFNRPAARRVLDALDGP